MVKGILGLICLRKIRTVSHGPLYYTFISKEFRYIDNNNQYFLFLFLTVKERERDIKRERHSLSPFPGVYFLFEKKIRYKFII